MELRARLEEKFADPIKCYQHCNQPSTFRVISDRPLIACYYCMAGYASRIMMYGKQADLSSFKAFLSKKLVKFGTIEDWEVRVATRNEWDSPDLGDVKVAYWTQNYRKAKTDDPNRPALFLCGRCNSLYVQPLGKASALCSDCSSEISL